MKYTKTVGNVTVSYEADSADEVVALYKAIEKSSQKNVIDIPVKFLTPEIDHNEICKLLISTIEENLKGLPLSKNPMISFML